MKIIKYLYRLKENDMGTKFGKISDINDIINKMVIIIILFFVISILLYYYFGEYIYFLLIIIIIIMLLYYCYEKIKYR